MPQTTASTTDKSSRSLYVREWRDAANSAALLGEMCDKSTQPDEWRALFNGHWLTKKRADYYAERATVSGCLLMLVEG